MCAEVLVPDFVPPEFIREVYVNSTDAQTRAEPLCGDDVPVTVKPWWLFR
jgi:hypothetical protein